ncbi:MAG: NUDIX domain-containing protein [Dehalococcoidia bacterium]
MGYKAPGSGREGSCVLLIAADGSILLQQRSDDVPPAGVGRWTPPGGGREGEETPRETALREFEEETGVQLNRLRFFETVTTEQVPQLLPRRLHMFFADDQVPRERIQVNEGLDFQYHHPDTFAELLMNPGTRDLLARFLATDFYRGTVAMHRPNIDGVGVLALDRWGRALLQLRDADLPPDRYPNQWSIPGGLLEPGEAPDSGALREFEEETGILLEELKFYRMFRRDPDFPASITDTYHIYFGDPDLDEAEIEVNEGQAFRYFAPDELATLEMPPHVREILAGFFESAHYRRLFH